MKKLIEIKNIVKDFDGQRVLNGISLDIHENEFVTLLGPSGCGKTTLLRIIAGFLDADDGQVLFDGKELLTMSEKELDQKYRKEDLLLFQDFTEGYQKRLEAFQIQDQIVRETLELLGKGSDASIIDSRGNTYGYENVEVPVYCVAEAYVERNEGEDDRILVLTERKKNSFTLKNALITVNDTDGFYFLWSGEEMYCPLKNNEIFQEKVADLTFAEGKALDRKIKNEKVGGVLLGVAEEGIELEDRGFLPFAEDYRVYQLYGSCKESDRTEFKIGYDFADYVMDKGKVCAVLLVKDQNMENIRVAVSNQAYDGIYHEEIKLKADCELNLIYGSYGDRQSRRIPAGEEVTIDSDSMLVQGDRLMIEPSAASSRIQVLSLKRAYGIPSYRGRMEIVKKEQGLLLINELLLEEYLYSVVPSEMPAAGELYPEGDSQRNAFLLSSGGTEGPGDLRENLRMAPDPGQRLFHLRRPCG